MYLVNPTVDTDVIPRFNHPAAAIRKLVKKGDCVALVFEVGPFARRRNRNLKINSTNFVARLSNDRI